MISKPPALLQQDVVLSIMSAAEVLQQAGSGILKAFDLTLAQFNVLRILRGAPEGLACGQIGDRMINRDPDITRLLDRMEARELIVRERNGQDRRVVMARISASGLKLLQRVDPEITIWHQRQFKCIPEKQLRQVLELMAQVKLGAV